MRPSPRLRGFPVFGFAVCGLLLGHAISYLLAIPDPVHRDVVLQLTGHDYLPLAVQAGLILLLGGVAAILVRAWTSRGADGTEGFPSIAGLLTIVQVVAFVGQELIERLVAGAPLHALSHDHLLPIGIAIQLVLALVGAATIRWLARLSARIVRAVGTTRVLLSRPALALTCRTTSDGPCGRIASTARNVRAPPSA